VADPEKSAGREPIQIVELDLDKCALTYGVAPCQAALGATGDIKCFNTRATCQDTANYDNTDTLTLRFTMPRSNLPAGVTTGQTVVDVTSWTLSQTGPDVSSQDGKMRGVFFKPDGTRMYLSGAGVEKIFEYSLGTAWDLSTISFVREFDPGVSRAQDVFFNPDGTRMFVLEFANPEVIRQYDLSTAWDISTASSAGIGETQTDAPQGFTFSPDGTRVYVTDTTQTGGDNTVHHYSLSTAWDVTTLSFVSSLNIEAKVDDVVGVEISDVGTKLFLSDITREITQYDLKTAWDLSSASFNSTFDLSPLGSSIDEPNGIRFADGESRLFLADPESDRVYEFSVGSVNQFQKFESALIPSLAGVRTRPSKIDLETGIGVRAKATVSLKDHPHHDRGIDPYARERSYDPYERSTFWRKLLARNPYYQGRAARIREGYVGQTLSEMRTRHYVIERIKGPDIEGNVSVELKDILKLTDRDRAKAPKHSTGQLSSGITAGASSATLAPAGVGDDEYPSSGTVAIGDEAIEFTRSGDTLTLTQRGAQNTEASDHDAGDTVQLCLVWDNEPPHDALYDLLTGYTTISASNIPKSDWDTEYTDWLQGFDLSGIVMEPTGVDELCGEILQQIAAVFWWDEYAQEVKLFAIKPPPEAPRLLNPRDHILEDAQSIEEKPDERASQIYLYYAQIDPTEDVDDPSNYQRVRGEILTDEESADLYGEARIRRVFARFLDGSNDGAANILVDRLTSRLRDTPTYLTIAVDAKDRDIKLGDLVDVESDLVVTADGQLERRRYQVIQREETDPGHRVVLRLQRYDAFLIGVRYSYVAADDAPDYENATAAERTNTCYVASGDPPTVGPDNDPPYLII
jgi:DNA-binding beta-propeller fold protein YncE